MLSKPWNIKLTTYFFKSCQLRSESMHLIDKIIPKIEIDGSSFSQEKPKGEIVIVYVSWSPRTSQKNTKNNCFQNLNYLHLNGQLVRHIVLTCMVQSNRYHLYWQQSAQLNRQSEKAGRCNDDKMGRRYSLI